MQAVLATPVAVEELGLLILKLGQQLEPIMQSCAGSRVLVSRAPAGLDGYRSGLVDVPTLIDESPLLCDEQLYPLWDALLQENDYYANELRLFVSLKHECQLLSEECHNELVLRKIGNSWVRLCWVHDNKLTDESLVMPIARRNQVAFWITVIAKNLRLPGGHPISMPELCWWLTVNGWINRLPDPVIRQVLNRPESSIKHNGIGFKDTDDLYSAHPIDDIVKRTTPVKTFITDPEPPAMFMLRPKPMRWESDDYRRYVKALPCVACGKQADDPHHLIGHGQGKMGGKSHDLFIIPLCRKDHNELHRNAVEWESKHGSQISHVIKTLDRALKEGALV